MKTQELRKQIPWSGIIVLSFFSLFIFLAGCESNTLKSEEISQTPPDSGRESGIEYYFPDSGGVRTQIILKGYNLGTDTSCLRVTVNGKMARIVGVKNDFIYAVVPARADTGLVRLYVTKGGKVEEFAYENQFLYKFVRNVTTFTGKDMEGKRIDGSLADARTQRPWFLLRDKDNTLYFLEEGRGNNKNGALRRIMNGTVETLYENNSGPFRSPVAMAFNPTQDTLYIAQWSSNENGSDQRTTGAVLYCTRDGGFVNMKVLVEAGENTRTTAVAVHPKTGEVFFNSQSDGYIYKYTGGGTNSSSYERIYQINNATNTELRMLFSPDGKTLYVVVRNRHCIYKASYDENTHTLSPAELWVGAWDESGYANGLRGVARFNNPGSPTIDSDGNLYVADKENHIIRKINPAGIVSLHAGIPQQDGYKDGGPEFARFRQPEAVEILDDGAVYVADRGTQCIRRVMVE